MRCSIREPLLLMGVPARPKIFSKKLAVPPWQNNFTYVYYTH